MGRERIRAVFFDLDDTLCDDLGVMERSIRQTAAHAAERLPGITADALTDAYVRLSDDYWWNQINLVKPPSIAEVRRNLWQKAMAECVSGEACDAALVEEVAEVYGDLRRVGAMLFPDALLTLEGLRAQGYKLALITNGVSETHAQKVVALGIRDHFDTVLMPDVIGVAKPDPRVFYIACERLGVAPEEAAHVGDSLVSDVAGAKQANLGAAIWFNPRGLKLPDDAPQPDFELAALSDLPELLAASR